MKEGTNKEDNHGSGGFGVAELGDGDVEMTHAPSIKEKNEKSRKRTFKRFLPMNWHIPSPPKGINVV